MYAIACPASYLPGNSKIDLKLFAFFLNLFVSRHDAITLSIPYKFETIHEWEERG